LAGCCRNTTFIGQNEGEWYIPVLVYQALLLFRTALACQYSTRLLRQTNLLSLYKVLGGGVRELNQVVIRRIEKLSFDSRIDRTAAEMHA